MGYAQKFQDGTRFSGVSIPTWNNGRGSHFFHRIL